MRKYNFYKMTALSEILKVKKTQLELMRDRGYDISKEERVLDDDFNLANFIEFYDLNVTEEYNYSNLLSEIYVKTDNPETKYAVVYSIIKTKSLLPVTEIDYFESQMNNHDCFGGMIISTNMASSSANVKLAILITKKKIQHYIVNELLYNPTKHFLVPKHHVLTHEEKQHFLKNNKNISISQLPIIRVKNLHLTDCWSKDVAPHGSCGDPIAKYYAVEVDQIVQINRENMQEVLFIDTYNIFRRVDNV